MIEINLNSKDVCVSMTRRNGGCVAKVGEVELQEIKSQLIYSKMHHLDIIR
jgi:hypothetical protein